MAIYNSEEQALLEEAHYHTPEIAIQEKPGKSHPFLVMGKSAVKRFFNLDPIPYSIDLHRIADEENDLYGQSDERDRLICHGKHSLREIKTGVSDTLPLKLL